MYLQRKCMFLPYMNKYVLICKSMYVLTKYDQFAMNTYHFVTNMYIFITSTYVLILLLMACYKRESESLQLKRSCIATKTVPLEQKKVKNYN